MNENLDLSALRKVAEAATPGPWELDDRDQTVRTSDRGIVHDDSCATRAEWAENTDARFIATFDPPTVLALLSRLEQAEQAVERAKAECTRQKEQKGILFRRATEAEQAVQRVRAMAEEMGEAIGFDRLAHGSEAEYPVSYFRDKLEEALDGESNV